MQTASPNTSLIHYLPRLPGSAISKTLRLLTFLLLVPAVLLAQPVPKLNSISPEWIQRGTTLDVTLTGDNLGSITPPNRAPAVRFVEVAGGLRCDHAGRFWSNDYFTSRVLGWDLVSGRSQLVANIA